MSKNDLHVYNVFSCIVTGFKKSRNFLSIQMTCEANFIGSIIGWQGQKHIEIVDALWHTREFQLYFLEKFYFKILLKNCVHVFIGQNSIKIIHIESFHYSSLNWVRSDKTDVYKLTKY